MDYGKRSLEKHAEWKGKIEVTVRAPVDSSEALSLAYTPGVATPCLEIQKDPGKSYELTRRWNMVAAPAMELCTAAPSQITSHTRMLVACLAE